MKILVVGGGFFGMYIAEYLARKGNRIILSEKESDFMKRASYRNQARIHNGCHYPRSILTAMRSRISFPKFVSEFGDCIDDSFDKYYMISRVLSKVSANQFLNFCKRVGIECYRGSQGIMDMVDPYYIEEAFSVKEFAFNAEKIKNVMLERIKNVGVEYHLNHQIKSIVDKGKKLIAHTYSPREDAIADLDMVFNCSYSATNRVIHNSKLELIPLKHELTEVVIVEVPDELQEIGITVMDGPFFSILPFPCKGLHSFSHVRYTPHYEWHDENGKNYENTDKYRDRMPRNSAWPYMVRDAIRYIPILSRCRYRESLWEIKTLLPFSENCDSRPILFMANHKMVGLHNIVGGKIDNIYDIVEVIERSGVLDAR